jgi:hypothetical protein
MRHITPHKMWHNYALFVTAFSTALKVKAESPARIIIFDANGQEEYD